MVDGKKVPQQGELFYQGYNIMDLKNGFAGRKFNFEEVIYLLLFGALPNQQQLQSFIEILSQYRELPNKFVRDVIMKAPSMDVMNALQRSVLTLYSYDENPDDISIPNVLKQSLSLIAAFPLISVYAYHAYQHYHNDKSLVIRYPDPKLSTAENILRILREDATVYGAGSEGAGYCPCDTCGAWRRKQLELYHTCRIFDRYRYVLCDFGIAWFAEGTEARRS